MNRNHRDLISMMLTIAIVVLSLFIIHKFIAPMLWAAMIAISTFPLYQRFEKKFGSYKNTSALLFTVIVSLFIVLPISWLATLLVKEFHHFTTYLIHLNTHGQEVPSWINKLPWFKKELTNVWEKYLAKPGSIKDMLMHWGGALTPAGYYVKIIGTSLAHRSVQLGFSLLSLFFFYRDGEVLSRQIDAVGEYCLSHRWHRFSQHLPQALRSIVNGTIVVGMGVGILLGVGYWILGLSAPALAGFITAIAAMVPFVAPIVFGSVALMFLVQSAFISSIAILVWGSLVMFFADHFVKPLLIGGAVRLPFLAVLFGILGGVETLGLLGLFIGPIVMVLFVTLWQEAQVE